jgi:hypothetical protein
MNAVGLERGRPWSRELPVLWRTRYFRLRDDVHLEGRWHVESPLDDQGREIEEDTFFGTPSPSRRG